MKTNEFFCVKCKNHVSCADKNIKMKTLKNGRPALTGKCNCGTKLFKFVKVASESKLRQKFKSAKRSKSKSRSKKRSKSRSKRRSKSRRRSRK